MKKKTLTIILSIILLICIGGNIYQNITTSELRESLSELANAKNELTAEIETKTIELNDVTSEIETANVTIGELTAKVDSLTSAINATQSKIDGINSTHTDVELGEDEYKGDSGVDALNANYNSLSPEKKAEVDAALERAKKRHPEWFTDDSAGNTNTSEGNYEHVGTPSTGELPGKLELDGDYSQYQGVTVY